MFACTSSALVNCAPENRGPYHRGRPAARRRHNIKQSTLKVCFSVVDRVQRIQSTRSRKRNEHGTTSACIAGPWLPIYALPHHHDQCQEPRIPNKTTTGKTKFLSTDALVFRRVDSGRTSRPTNGKLLVRNLEQKHRPSGSTCFLATVAYKNIRWV